MITNNRLTKLIEGFIVLTNIADEKTVYETLHSAIFGKIKKINGSGEQSTVRTIQDLVEAEYNLCKGALNNSFPLKDRELTEPKFMWVMVVLTIFKGDRAKVKRLIGNGVTRQKIYYCNTKFVSLSEKIKPDKEIIIKYHKLIHTYEQMVQQGKG